MDVAKLLEPHGDDEPSGENLEYDPGFVDMELAAQPGEERQEGDKILEAEDPDFGDVVKKAVAVMERSHDIRAAVFFAEAVLHTKGLTGFAQATAFVRGCLETYWDSCHPELDEDDDNDPTMRINAVQGFNGTDTVIRALRKAPLTESRMFGSLGLRMIEIAEGVSAAPASMTEVPDSAAISAAFQDTDSQVLSDFLAAALSAQADFKAIDAIFVEKTPGQGPDLEDVQKVLNQVVRRLSEAVGGDAVVPEEGGEGAAGEAPAEGAAPVAASAPAGIQSPSDVSNALDRIISYYERQEPSSPMPILLERAKKLVGADFLTIMKEIAPQGLEQAKNVGGIKGD
ncbi:type VI secretion system protein TssA [Sulfitobacter sp. M57]|uniref:type VI secretion system protein TssA n=1 Tax=unclassified Sulfitobacter TaxID=196795 RepID=UPI0023E2FC89|nr:MULTISPECIES: type VI secretion system protein TssA [unclassified Sulfitobacter]MDF3416591.1 type VI secretion system protein TssA [Sulfitobacter sp. KE5]MDF3424071.1 type VI secretion system protein TssA [Sulfitobacter sp. KE43]MDF3435136.1 type VI secretion system protein TssA [Sulfitobacter sp. KE42]MDF3460776.1 type VI secretion system protein TssA [Sulfitobacter sp. S74]MDF3464673.1 type VI secretion system protein TssA [Sulfitobacter sp. Ks18]